MSVQFACDWGLTASLVEDDPSLVTENSSLVGQLMCFLGSKMAGPSPYTPLGKLIVLPRPPKWWASGFFGLKRPRTTFTDKWNTDYNGIFITYFM